MQAQEEPVMKKTWLEKKKYSCQQKSLLEEVLGIKRNTNLLEKKDWSHITYYSYNKRRNYAQECSK